MFEMTFSDGKRRGMAFDGRNAHPVYVTPHGSAITRKDWDRMKRLAYDDNELSPSGERDGAATQDHLAKLRAAIKKLALKSGKDDGEYQEMLDNVLEPHGGQSRSDGAAATDRHRRARDADPLDGHGVPGDDADEVAEKVREILASMGWDDEKIEATLAKHREEAMTDSRPEPGTRGGRGGRFSDAHKDAPTGRYPGISSVLDNDAFEAEFPESKHTTRDVYGAPASEQYDPVRWLGERAAERLPGGGVSPRMPAGDAAIRATDADLAREYPGIENVVAIP